MNKFLIGFLALLAFACGSPTEEDYYETGVDGVVYNESWFDENIDIGQTTQAITVTPGYGTIDGTNGIRCVPQTGTVCKYPRDKDAYYRFKASTCSSWWQARVVSAWNDWLVVDRDLGWTIRDPAPGGFADYYLSCQDAGSNNLGVFNPSDSVISGTEPNRYKTHTTGTIYIDTAAIQALPEWSSKTDVQRQRFARNAIIHELFHSSGLGHPFSGEQPNSVMLGPGPTATSTWWTNLRYPTGTELGYIQDYVP